MDIQGTNSKNSADTLEQLKQLRLNYLDLNSKTNSKDTDQDSAAVDSANSDAFSSLKLQVSQAKQSGRAEYISQLQQSIAAGTYNVSSSDLANALIADGVGEFLVS